MLGIDRTVDRGGEYHAAMFLKSDEGVAPVGQFLPTPLFEQAAAVRAAATVPSRVIDAVIELKVDEDALVKRMETRVAETIAAGGQVRADDNPESFKKRLVEYREKTAPLSAYYAGTGELRTVDGMKPIDVVSQEIEAILAA